MRASRLLLHHEKFRLLAVEAALEMNAFFFYERCGRNDDPVEIFEMDLRSKVLPVLCDLVYLLFMLGDDVGERRMLEQGDAEILDRHHDKEQNKRDVKESDCHGILFCRAESHESSDLDLLAEFLYGGLDQIIDGKGRIFDEFLLNENALLEKGVELAEKDLLLHCGRLVLHFIAQSLAYLLDLLCRHLCAAHVCGIGRSDLHRDLAGKFLEILVL